MNQGRLIFKQLVTGEWIPFINGQPIHSTVKPIDTEKTYIAQFASEIKLAKNILVFGLGAGFHIEEIKKIASQTNQQKNICVIEPNKQLIDKFEKITKNSRPYTFYTEYPEDLFYKDDFINFLLLSPLIIIHPQSIQAHQKYFDALNSYRPPRFLENSFNQFKQNVEKFKSKDQKDDFIKLALQNMKEIRRGENQV